MSYLKIRQAVRTQSKKIIIRTNFLDLIGKLLESTHDDAAVVASIRRIFDDCNARMIRSLAPIRLIADEPGAKVKRQALSTARI
jgi:hypothetical protein